MVCKGFRAKRGLVYDVKGVFGTEVVEDYKQLN